jgi:hypothetical protein
MIELELRAFALNEVVRDFAAKNSDPTTPRMTG